MSASETAPSARKFLASAGSYNWNVPRDVFKLDAVLAGYLGVDEVTAAKGIKFKRFLEGVHPDDRERINDKVDQSIKDGKPCRQEYRLVDTAGHATPIIAMGQCFRDEIGEPAEYAGMMFEANSYHADRQAEGIVEHCLSAYASAKHMKDDMVTYLLSMVLQELGYQEAAKLFSKTRH